MSSKVFVLFCVAGFGGGFAAADPIPSYAATNASITWSFALYSNETISLLGPELSLNGGAGNFGGLRDIGITPGTPFGFTFPIVNGDQGGSVSGTIGGVSDTNFWISSPDLFIASDAVFTAADLTATVPAMLTGTITLCLPGNQCFLYGGSQYFKVNLNLPGILKLGIANIGTSSSPQYGVYSAQFTTVPEPNTALLLCFAVAGEICLRGRSQSAVAKRCRYLLALVIHRSEKSLGV